ncbi:MAG: nitroreductase [Chitinophagaceae bacterium]|nr:nitroreductase [Chitinophagaceae bacterium]
MNQQVQALDTEQAIRLRRTVKPDKMNGRLIDDETINRLLTLADWAPTHARTEPWRFVVFGGDQVAVFAKAHADLFKEHTPQENFTQQKYDNIERLGINVSHVIIAWMKRVSNHKIPELEEIASTASAIQNLLLGATANGIASFWSTGGMTLQPAFHNWFKLGEEDRILGTLYLGYTNEPFREGSRMIPLSEKIEWVK